MAGIFGGDSKGLFSANFWGAFTWKCSSKWLMVFGFLVLFGLSSNLVQAASSDQESRIIATSLATMLQSARTVISKHQSDINDATRGDKGLSADVVLKEARANYQNATGIDPDSYSITTRHGRLIQAQMMAIKEVMNNNQTLINKKGVGFKGFIPATFARLVNETFSANVGEEASVKVTAPMGLVRNRKARPDNWEKNVIKTYFLSANWERGKPYAENTKTDGKSEFRMAVPEYYASSCLSCHGTPKGSLDVTGYPREGAKDKDLGGVISVRLSDK